MRFESYNNYCKVSHSITSEIQSKELITRKLHPRNSNLWMFLGSRPRMTFFLIIWLYKKMQSKNTKQIWNIPKSIETMNWNLKPIIIKPELKENSLGISLYLFVWLFLCFIGFGFFMWLEFSKAQVKAQSTPKIYVKTSHLYGLFGS